MTVTTDSLLNEIESVFPIVEMPGGDDLTFHRFGCAQCDDLRRDLELYRGKEITGELIRLIHQELSQLSAESWRWILPSYLKFCLTPEAEYNRMEIEFLIYNFGPEPEFQADTSTRLSMLNQAQIDCLIHFVEWCGGQEYWREIYLKDLNRAVEFLTTAGEGKNTKL